MTKELTMGALLEMMKRLENVPDLFGQTQLKARDIYNTIKLKEELTNKVWAARQATIELAKKYEASPNGEGLQVPPEKLDEFNREYLEFTNSKVTIEYEKITIPGDAVCSPEFIETFLDFIEIVG